MIDQRNKIHPQKLMMWIAMGSMFMVFAGFTSAFLLQQTTNSTWVKFKMPTSFWASTIVILLSSYTMHKAVNSFKNREMNQYKSYMLLTIITGLVFIALQLFGFHQLLLMNLPLDGAASGGFLYVIAGLHILHILGGIIALVVMYFFVFRNKTKLYSNNGHQILATYWHFVDILWVYLFIFFLINFN